jgi:hypothetical protein
MGTSFPLRGIRLRSRGIYFSQRGINLKSGGTYFPHGGSNLKSGGISFPHGGCNLKSGGISFPHGGSNISSGNLLPPERKWVKVRANKITEQRNSLASSLPTVWDLDPGIPSTGKLVRNLAGMRIQFHKQTNKLNDAPVAHAAHQTSRR